MPLRGKETPTEARVVDEGVPLAAPVPFDWMKADRYARNYILLRIEDVARGLESAAIDPGLHATATRSAKERAYAARAAIVLLAKAVLSNDT